MSTYVDAQPVLPGRIIKALLVQLASLFLAMPTLAQDDPGRAAYARAGCGTCHGSESSGLDPMLVPMNYDLNAFTSLVRQGIGHMPAVPRSEVSDTDLTQLHGYLLRLGEARRPGTAQSARQVTAEELWPRLAQARRAGDLDALRIIAADARRVALESELSGAAATWELIAQSPSPPFDSARRLEDATAGIERVLDMQATTRTPDSEKAVAHAFLGALWAMQLSQSRATEESLSGKIEAEITNAFDLAPENPSVLFLAGAAAALAPDIAGGLDAAKMRLERARVLFTSASSVSALTGWNAADANAWLGRVLFTQGDTVGARRAYQQALEVEPNFLWIIRVLLPELAR